MAILLIPLSHINANPWQTRNNPSSPEYIKELALDIEANGLLQIPIGRFKGGGIGAGELEGAPVQLAFGHNRLAAYRWLYDLRDNSDIQGDWRKMPVDVRVLTDEQLADMAWAENDKRSDCTPLERAMAIRKRMDDFGWSQKDIADHLRISAPVISNALRLLELPDEIQQHISSGAMSERAALALLTLYELPESLRDKAERASYENQKPSFIIEQAISGLSSDSIRDHIEQLVKNYAKDLHQALWDLDYIFITSEAIYWPECRTCELRHKPLNVCTKPDCYETKTRAWKADYLQQAGQVSGILPLEPEINTYETTHWYYRIAAVPILSSGCENLRLVYSHHSSGGPFTLEEKGYPKTEIVCRKKNGHCQCLEGLEILEAQRRRVEILAIQNTPKVEDASPEAADEIVQSPATEQEQSEPKQPTAAELHDLVKQEESNEKKYKKLAKEAQDRAAKIIVDGLATEHPGAWRLIYDRVALGEHWDKRPNDVIEIRKGIAEKIVKYRVQYKAPAEVVDSLNGLLIEAGLQAPVF